MAQLVYMINQVPAIATPATSYMLLSPAMSGSVGLQWVQLPSCQGQIAEEDDEEPQLTFTPASRRRGLCGFIRQAASGLRRGRAPTPEPEQEQETYESELILYS